MSTNLASYLSGRCPVCDGSTFQYRFVTNGYRVAACAGCGLLAHRRDASAALAAEQAGRQRLGPASEAERRHWLGLLSRLSPTGSVVEANAGSVGRGHGAIAIWDAPGFAVRPEAFLTDVHDALVENGVALLTLPSSGTASGHQWPPFSQPYNWYFNHVNVETLLFKTGFDQVSRWMRAEVAGGGDDMVLLARRRDLPPRWKVSIIVPVYNEARTFPRLITAVRDLPLCGLDKEIIVVESGSTDGTHELALELESWPDVTVLFQENPRGKGSAVREALQVATGDFVVIQDADLEYDLNDYEMLLHPLLHGEQAFVIGSRHAASGWKIRRFARSRGVATTLNAGHWLFAELINALFDQRLADPFSMFKVFRRDCLHGLRLECDRFDFDHELVIKLIRKGYTPLEIPVNYVSRSFAEGKKISVLRDPWTWLRAIVKYKRQPLSAFLDRPSVTP